MVSTPSGGHSSLTTPPLTVNHIEQPPELFRKLYPSALWRMNPDEKAVYLTFDDGPIPVVTPWVLDLLDQHNIKATFFMVGDNIRKHPEEFRMVVERGHRIGNHTFNHIRGFSRRYFTSYSYLENTEEAHDFMLSICDPETTDKALHPLLFRPPHGHMGWAQYMLLKRPQVLANVMRYARNGSIITFHDSLKSWDSGNLQYALPRALNFLEEEGYAFKVL